MLNYTRSVFENTLAAIKRIAKGIELSVQGVYIIYLVVALLLGSGIFMANAILLTISVVYLIYDICTTKEWYTKEEKSIRHKAKKVANCAKKVVQIIVIGVAIMELATGELNAISVLITLLMTIGFAFSLLFNLTITAIEKRKKLILIAIKQDFAVFSGAKKVMHKVTHHELTEEEKEEAKMKVQLDEICEIQKEKRKEKRIWKKQIAKQARLKKKQAVVR